MLALMLLAPAPSLGVFCAMIWPGDVIGHWVFILCKVWLVALPTVWWWHVEAGRPRFFRPRLRPVLVGALLGTLMGAAILISYGLGFASRIDPTALREAVHAMGLSRPLPFAAATLYWSLLNSAVEEYVYRWFLLRQLDLVVSKVPAAVIAASVFTAHHVIAMWVYLPPGFLALASSGVFVGGLIWALLFQRYRSVWSCWISHMLVDIAVFAVGWGMLFGQG